MQRLHWQPSVSQPDGPSHLNPLPAIVRFSQPKGAGALLLLLLLLLLALRALAGPLLHRNRVSVAAALRMC